MMRRQAEADGSAEAVKVGGAAGAASMTRRPAAAALQRQVVTTTVGLQMPVGLTFEEWERAGRKLSGLLNSASWWLGDWLVYGTDHYADRYERGISAVGLKYQTLRNYAWVSRRFELHRRRAELSFQHHAELASLGVVEQDAWLDRAERMQWSTKQLRKALRAERDGSVQRVEAVVTTRRLAVPDHRLQWWHEAAVQAGTELEEWVTATLDTAADQVLRDSERRRTAQDCLLGTDN